MSEQRNKERSQVTGTKMGKGARRALLKNSECVDEFLALLREAESREALAHKQETSSLMLARVARSTGAGRLEVTLQSGERISAAIAGTLKFKGASATKTDRANCMCANDIIVVRGGLASGKMSLAVAAKVEKSFARLGVTVPAGFFGEKEGGNAGDGWEFDRSEEEAEAEAEVDLEDL